MADNIVSQDPTKPGQFKVNGPALVSGKVPLVGLDGTGAALNDVISFDGANWVPSPAAPSADTASNLGAGAQVFKSKVGNDFQFRSVIGTGSVTATQNANDITLNGAVITASNLGAGNGVFASKVGNDLQFKSLVAGANVTLTPTGNDITIALAGTSGVFTQSFQSTAQTMVNSGTLTIAHGMGTKPLVVQLYIKAKNAVHGYSVGDEVFLPSGALNASSNWDVSIRRDATNILVKFPSSGIAGVVSLADGSMNTIAVGDWDLFILAFA